MRSVLLSVVLALPSMALAGQFTVASIEVGPLTRDGRPVEAGAALDDGSVLHLAAGKAVLDFGGEGKLLLTGPADFTVETRGIALKAGGLLSVLNRLKGGFQVRTPAAVAAVRGTEFFVEPRGEHETYLCLCRGRIEVTGVDGAGKPIAIKSANHKSYLFSRVGAVLTKRAARMEGHSDAEIADLKK